MRGAIAGVLSVVIGLQPVVLRAQRGQATPSAEAGAGPQDARPSTPDPYGDVLAASFSRIRRALNERPPSKDSSGLKLDFYVEVVGQAPPIKLFYSDDLRPGAVPGGPPTHRDMLDLMTPQEFRSPSIPLASLVVTGIQKLLTWDSDRRKREEAEKRKKEQEERRLRLYGPAAGPPK
jgi:hypothetical protein